MNILLLSLGCENNILLPSIFVGHWNKIKFLFMRCNSAISHLNNLANFFSKVRQSATSATIFRFQVSKAVLKGVCNGGSAHMNSTLKVPRTLKSYSCIPSVFPDTHIVGSKTKSKHFQKCAKSSKRTPYFFLQKHMFSL